ncbi:peptidoglycan-binding domain-containing protein [Streptomyces sp. NPDC001984]|uniref:peptidoglycan-binding domain-containing protein n=1 Tax=Streptomyces sp. NPDC002619 TaxID=3364655 RepID=UPI003687834B
MSTPPDPDQPQRGPALEPVRVLRPRRFDALAELMREVRQDAEDYETVTTARSHDTDGADDRTQELPRVPATGPVGPGRGLRGAAALVAVTAAALVGFGCALLLPGRGDAATPAPAPSVTVPDGLGTLRQGDSGPEVTELQERLLRIPDVYRDGTVNGRYDAQLTEAVARFQLWYGIRGDETGVYGNDTRQALESRTSTDAG